MTLISLTPEEGNAMRGRNKLLAIRLVRERTGLGLAEAKKYVELWDNKTVLQETSYPCPHCEGTGRKAKE